MFQSALALVFAVLSFALSAQAATQFRGQPAQLCFASLTDFFGTHTADALKDQIRDYKALNPSFSEESCKGMYETKLKLGSSVPPGDFVMGCDKVCASAKAIKEYWGSGDMAAYACETVGSFGCVWDGTPPVQASGIGC